MYFQTSIIFLRPSTLGVRQRSGVTACLGPLRLAAFRIEQRDLQNETLVPANHSSAMQEARAVEHRERTLWTEHHPLRIDEGRFEGTVRSYIPSEVRVETQLGRQ